MPLILRIDVDKPYGNHTLIRKLASKFFEETAFPCPLVGYLDHLKDFLTIIDEQNIPAIFYFRICTLPGQQLITSMLSRGHRIGWHAENTRSLVSFKAELEIFKAKTGIMPHSFSKHGSGVRKLGRYHYPPYEMEKYIDWSKQTGIPFFFGNDPYTKESKSLKNFHKEIFWIEKNYRNEDFKEIKEVIERAQNESVPIITHPENIIRDVTCKKDFLELINESKAKKIEWLVY